MKAERRSSFTLIEVLVVMVVIAILAGIVFRLSGLSGKSEEKAKTVEVLTRVAGALEEFKSEYGVYPPVKPGVCTFHGDDCRICYQYENTNEAYMAYWENNNYFTEEENVEELNFEYGLVAFLDTRKRDTMNPLHLVNPDNSDSAWIGDNSRDKRAKGRWSQFMTGVITTKEGPTHYTKDGKPFTNNVDTILDGWDRVIKYESDPPYLSYELWSKGDPETEDDDNPAANDIHRDSM